MLRHSALVLAIAALVAPAGAALAATVTGTGGDDVLEGTPKADTVRALAGDDVVRTFAGPDVVFAGRGHDEVRAGVGRDEVFGGPGRDLVRGEEGDDVLHGQDGRDPLAGGNGSDSLYGGPRADALDGGNGPDLLRGHGGRDGLTGGAGDDVLYGGRGGDWLTDWVATELDVTGPQDRDRLVAGQGNDFIGLADGADEVRAGPGDDLVKIDVDGTVDVIDCGPGRDRVLYYGPIEARDVLRGCERVVEVALGPRP